VSAGTYVAGYRFLLHSEQRVVPSFHFSVAAPQQDEVAIV
jgi:hypothetical protein